MPSSLPQSMLMPDAAMLTGKQVSVMVSKQDGKTGVVLTVPTD